MPGPAESLALRLQVDPARVSAALDELQQSELIVPQHGWYAATAGGRELIEREHPVRIAASGSPYRRMGAFSANAGVGSPARTGEPLHPPHRRATGSWTPRQRPWTAVVLSVGDAG